MCVGNEQCQIREMQKMTACRHFFVFFLFDRAVLGAGGTCLARTEVERDACQSSGTADES